MDMGPQLFLENMLRCGAFPPRKIPVAALFLYKSSLMVPARWAEDALVGARIRAQVLEPPLFVVGHYRSGTTLLLKLLSGDDRFSTVKTFNFLFPHCPPAAQRVVQPALQAALTAIRFKHYHFNDYLYDLDDPIEEDMVLLGASSRYSAFWAELFPKGYLDGRVETWLDLDDPAKRARWLDAYRHALQKIAHYQGGKPLLLKNPPNTARIGALVDAFPGARFLYIRRNPFQVFYSTFQLWKRTLLPHYALQSVSDADVERFVLTHYRKLMSAYDAQKHLIPDGRLAEIAYEDLKKDPLGTLRTAYPRMGLEFGPAEAGIQAKIDDERAYVPYTYTFDDATQDRVEEAWGEWIHRWGYGRLKKGA